MQRLLVSPKHSFSLSLFLTVEFPTFRWAWLSSLYASVVIIAIISAIIVTTLNTVAMYLASKLEGWYTSAYVFGTLVYRFAAGIILAVVFSLVLPELLRQLKKYR